MTKEQAQKLLALVRRNYQEIAADFDATRRKEIWPEARRLAEEVKDGDSVLDAGCGNGRLLEAWPNKEINYLGFDSSSSLVELAKKNYPSRCFMVGDILAMDSLTRLDKEKFDHIFCLAVLPHIPGRELRQEVLRKLATRLKPGGRLIISAWNLWTKRKFRSLIFKSYWSKILGKSGLDFNDLIFPWRSASGEKTSQRYYHAFTKSELRNLSLAAGLRVTELKKDEHNYWIILQNK